MAHPIPTPALDDRLGAPRRDNRVGKKAPARPCAVCGTSFQPCIRRPEGRFCSKRCVWLATEGPWQRQPQRHGKMQDHDVVSPAGDAELGNWMVAPGVRWMQDADFITGARNHAPSLARAYLDALAEIERLRPALELWLAYAEENLSAFDLEICESETLCPRCQNSGCINLKIRETRTALHPQAGAEGDEK